MAEKHTESYRGMRDFSRTPKPEGGSGGARGKPIFVVQRHDASTEHYDFRIEVDGTMKSWAVPKGPSTDPRDKRLAVPTEDHPVEYADFEGVIPEGEYGAGTVLVWDRGSYENLTRDEDGGERGVAEALEAGHVVLRLHGEKIAGGYALQRIGTGDETRWLLVKVDDEAADARRNPVSTEPDSVLSGRSIDEIGKDG
ncbi:MAG TPA: DNA polymerase ligase N-terminal domain-containing protein [Amaricoccus sp.]|uniref:DNA polymerase ligase N-terminal domain-containing protein n=1 Tax=Amaricoccus sp. TaxID=1872485 RepID=UPI002B85D5C0|nr:DNA polymerase ligase N-terminal domain-containing protein [Amaricoccus sp.]HMQ92637.1 DNA polymerase ligase N-terminal domain-containing protein [Amaricoccus sp.]HMR52885.1 DNA polymerase ligase N-terminal domain-containing protein [Amaricoccus sp.]HMR59241.1 DNA polymerase ligase N-terminal domain-containing protein [Amaricoccus sp.]HMT97734.1 DNA polymerase ligase N-terminal domain-containing protein [Amaricoccus sp.]